MPKPIIISSQEDEESAIAFAKFAKGDRVDRNAAFKKGQLDRHVGPDSGPFILMAHTDDTRKNIGGLTPKKLAEEFASGISREKRAEVKDLYLISCEAGLLPDPSLAKQLSVELKKQGFTNLQVHAVSSASVNNAPGMYVQVITRPGFSTAVAGSLQAYAYTNDAAGRARQKIDEDISKLNEVPTKERNSAHNKAIFDAREQIISMTNSGATGIQPLMSNQQNFSQLINEFNKPENTFGAVATAAVVEKPKPSMFDRFVNKATNAFLGAPNFKIELEKAKFITAYDELKAGLSNIAVGTPAYAAAEELINALEPIHREAERKDEVRVPVSLTELQFSRLDRALNTAREAIPAQKSTFDKIVATLAKFFGIEHKTTSEKKLSAMDDVISTELKAQKSIGPKR